MIQSGWCFLPVIFITTITFNRTISYHGVRYPDWSVTLGWGSCMASMACIPLYMGYKLLYFAEGDLIDRFKFAVRPSKEWGPANPEDRKQWVNMLMRRKVKHYRTNQDDNYHQQFVELCVEIT